jgi:serine phosphatase RsbU (regulator of sigma subunit)/DNA-binding LacI/PurR family transcriptional regulator
MNTQKRQPSMQPQRRRTIGYLANSTSGSTSGGIDLPRWIGVADAARQQDANLISFVGRSYREVMNFNELSNILYDLIDPDALDGVIVGSILSEYVLSEEDIRAFYQRLPGQVVCIRQSLPGIPHIPLDNYEGMREALVHLIEVHQYRRIAFLRGPTHPYAEERYRAYRDVLQEYQIPFDPNLVTPPSAWEVSSIEVLLDERKLRPGSDFEAVVAASDTAKAISALKILQVRGFRVPQDVAVVGFDNTVDGRVQTPSLTSVRVPFYEQGQQAVHLLFGLMVGEEVPQSVSLPAQLVLRQSCGCVGPAVMQAAAGPILASNESYETALRTRQAEILTAMAQPLERRPNTPAQAQAVFEGFFAEMQGGAKGTFVAALNAVLSQIIGTTGKVAEWQDVLSAFRRVVLPYLHDGTAVSRAEDLWGQARVVIGESMQHVHEIQQFQATQQTDRLRQIEREMMATFDIAGLMDVLAQGLPRLGIPACYLALYEDPPEYAVPQQAPEWARLILAYTDQGRADLEQEGRRFPARQLVPPEFLPQDRPYHLLIEALNVRDNQLGFVLFEVGPRDGNIYEVLRLQISSALQGALLVQRVQEHAHELAAAYEEIRILNNQLKEENLRMSAELDVSRRIQQMMLPPAEELQHLEGIEIVGYMKPADEVGGDYYDVLKENGMIHIGIGDVTGHGLESGVLMLMTQTAIRTLIEHGETDPVIFLETLNRILYKNIRRMKVDKTLMLAFINYQHGQLKLIGQHEELLVVRQGGQVERVDTVNLGFPLGLEESIADFVAEATVSLQPGESIVLYTDGITEAENAEKQLYGIERLCEVVSQQWDQSAEAIKQAVIDDIMRHIGMQKVYDDLTLVVLKQK